MSDRVGIINLPRTGEADSTRQAVVDDLFFEGPRRAPYLGRYAALIVLSSAIAALGLLVDSAAVVIGAMLVAPLMTPILASAAALVLAETRRLVDSVLIVAGGAVMAVGTAWIVASISPLGTQNPDNLTREVLARTTPGLLDLGVAVAAGAAAAFILTRRDTLSALPGVAIAVALIPPLATVGIALRVGANDRAQGALLLFGTNLSAIIFAAALVLLASGYIPVRTTAGAWRRVNVGLAAVVLGVVAIAIPLTLHTIDAVEEERVRLAVGHAVADWDPTVRIVDLTVDNSGSRVKVELSVAGPNQMSSANRLALLIAERRGGQIDLSVSHTREESAQVSVR